VIAGLRRHRIPFDYVAGTSIGAAIAALTVGDYTPDEIADILDELSSSLFRLTIPVRSFLSNRGVRRYIAGLAGDRRIEDLPVPLALIAADIVAQQELVLRRGLIWPAVVASISIPGIYPAQRIGPHLVVDGGVLNPVPGNVVDEMGAGVVIAVKLSAGSVPPERDLEVIAPSGAPPNAITVLLRSIELMQSRIAAEPGEATTITITPKLDVDGAKLRNFKEGRRWAAQGEQAVEAALARIEATLPWVRE
jgi:NTE family protein